MLVSAVPVDAQQTKLQLRSFLEVLCDKRCLCCCTFSSNAGLAAHRLRLATSALHTAIKYSYMEKSLYLQSAFN